MPKVGIWCMIFVIIFRKLSLYWYIGKRMGETFGPLHNTARYHTKHDQKADQRENGTLPRELCYHTMCDPTPLPIRCRPTPHKSTLTSWD